MKISQEGINLIKSFEGFSAIPYQCSADVWTIGYGHTKNVTKFHERISKEYAEELLRKDLLDAEIAVDSYVKVPLTQNQFDALVSFVFNLGAGSFKKSTLLKKLNKGEYDQVPYELMRWNKAGGKVLTGLSRRRAAEAELWSRQAPENLAIEPIAKGSDIKRDVPSVVNKENISWAAGIGGSGAAALGAADGSGPVQYALAAIIVLGFAAALFWFFSRRGR